MSQILVVTCPVCAQKVEWRPEQRFKPFCSERCKLIDLGDWATDAYKIPCETVDPEENWGLSSDDGQF